ncbi:MAG TPA: GNAT family N-acetyltransferase [Bdellovibrionales bacterium]|nr:GNAT family N-acetyltransferase [Bdellovibrionales bacterium]
MAIQSLGFKTEMIFHRFDGLILDRGDYIVVKTPSNPGFFFGNLLLFFQAPKLGSLHRWKKTFRKEFADLPEVKHLTFLWDSPTEGRGDITELEQKGFKVDFSVVLTAKTVHQPKKMSSQVVIRPISTEDEWRQVTENQILSKSADFKESEYRVFKERQMARYRAMAQQGLGHWFGAFLEEKLVGDLGIYRDGKLGRFQSVETHPDFRRRGICGALVYKSAQFALAEMGLKDLVMVADENYHAAKIYESVGFAPAAKEYSAFWWDQGKEYRE